VNLPGVCPDCAFVAAQIYIKFCTDPIFEKIVRESRQPFGTMIAESGYADGFVQGTRAYEKLVLILEVLGSNGVSLV
jgi:phosphotransacetylase